MRLTGWIQRVGFKGIGWLVLAAAALLSRDRASAQLLQEPLFSEYLNVWAEAGISSDEIDILEF